GWSAVSFGGITYVESNQAVLGQEGQIKVAHLRARVEAVFARNGIWRHAKACRRKHPIGVRDVVEITKVLKAPVISVEPIKLGLLRAKPDMTIRVGSPTG